MAKKKDEAEATEPKAENAEPKAEKAEKAEPKAKKAKKADKADKADKAEPKAKKPKAKAKKAESADDAPKMPRRKAKHDDGYEPRLRVRYREEVAPKLMKEFGIENPMAVPRIDKVCLNMGVGEAIANIKVLDDAVDELAQLAGQRPMITRAQKSIANFKLRAGMPIGARVTLRGERMWHFLDRLIAVALPRVRDFRGIPSRSFDGRGNYTLGIRDHLIFPEIDFNKVDKSKGLNVTIVTTAGNDERAFYLLRELGMPFRTRQAA